MGAIMVVSDDIIRIVVFGLGSGALGRGPNRWLDRYDCMKCGASRSVAAHGPLIAAYDLLYYGRRAPAEPIVA